MTSPECETDSTQLSGIGSDASAAHSASRLGGYSGPIGTVGPVGVLGVAAPETVDSEPKE